MDPVSDLLSVTRISTITEVLVRTLQIPQTLVYLNRVPVVDADEGEIMGEYSGRVVSANIVNDDQAAVMVQAGRVSLNTQAIPNLKIGSKLSQSLRNRLNRISRGGGIPGDNGIITNFIRNEVKNRLDGVRILMNRFLAGMMVDDLTYKKLGITYTGVSWGMPSDLKFVPSIEWTAANAATMTPINDLLTFLRYASTTYGQSYNRFTSSTTIFQNIVGSTEFRNKAQAFTTLATTATNFGALQLNNTLSRQLFEAMTGLQFEVDDSQFQDELNDGTVTTHRYLAENVGFLGNTGDDNNEAAMDFGNTIVNETEGNDVPGIIGGGFPAPQTGPVSYAVHDGHNPPGQSIWAVARGFPRKKNKYATARITAWAA